MFAVIYRFTLKAETDESEFIELWNSLANHFIKHHGALGSRLHKSTEDNIWIAYSQWPNRAARDKAWPVSESAKEIIDKILLLRDEEFPEICMDIKSDYLSKTE